MSDDNWEEPVKVLLAEKLRHDARRIMRNDAQAEHLLFLRWLYPRLYAQETAMADELKRERPA